MKPIKLTYKQKEKLIEMVKALFPEFTGKITAANKLVFNGEGNKLIFIHWFEFCMGILQNKVYNKLAKINTLGIDTWNKDLIGNLYRYKSTMSNHLVDYLYKEFKKSK